MSPKLGSKEEMLSRLVANEHSKDCHVLYYEELHVQMLLCTFPGGHD